MDYTYSFGPFADDQVKYTFVEPFADNHVITVFEPFWRYCRILLYDIMFRDLAMLQWI